ncbi:arylamine N-acetyltransferase [Pseudoalteromonas sp. C2R02]|uniref:arylamine N-acetyltransferase family protein n=1 Tax=Pseudoalteromonas sp. C2R02 TaxID=2841565 RepID=UPI001C0A202C|nr:arylamine N-acetyltransferase [Pseudoalteromonas sp. C2R02]MBU2967971.1 arylamine N-acetyltransferase [Pseudoalteromonas sp. C2R02]
MRNYLNNYFEILDLPFNLKEHDLIETMINKHISLFSFSSLNVILNKDLSLEPKPLFERVIQQSTGGYCFEHNKIFYLALEHLGFEVRPLIARVMLNNDPENGRSHRLTLLTLNNQQYIIDVGFGVMSPRGLIALSQSDNTILPFAQYQVELDDRNTYRIIKTNELKPVTLYRLDLSEATETDCDISHFYSHKHEQAAFVNHLVVSRIDKDTRYLIRNLTFTKYDDSLNTHLSKLIENSFVLRQLLQENFKISISNEEAHFIYEHQMNLLEKNTKKAS